MNILNKIRQPKAWLVALMGMSLAVTSCDKERELEVTPVKFKIAASATVVTQGESIVYTDSSKDVAYRSWTFEGGDITASEDVSPQVMYTDSGRYPVTLDVVFNDSAKESRLIYVNIRPEIEVEFSANRTSLGIGAAVQYTNFTTGGYDSLEWTFEGGDPAISYEENPLVTYSTVGNYAVSLRAWRKYPENADEVVRADLIEVTEFPDIFPLETNLRGDGGSLTLVFETEMKTPDASEAGNFLFLADGAPATISTIELDPNDAKNMILTLDPPVLEGQFLTLSYTPGALEAVNGSKVGELDEKIVQNSIVNLFAGLNADFELGLEGSKPDNWGTWWPDGGANVDDKFILDGSDPYNGNYSVKGIYDIVGDRYILNAPNAAAVDVEANTTYLYSFWAKSSVDGINLDIRTVGGSAWEEKNNGMGGVTLTTEWTYYSYTFSTDDLTELKRRPWMQLKDDNTTFEMWIDDIKLYKVE
ncbi:PKD domain-containing protein [Pontibacter sp. G13]|uniref:PKD domain-containing protein n=1 Tax=Pontibacter sp. G13 TaxID=3074898 RepID=UPI00288C168E|nr:carbohydrate binding domain-containing protein [Pontibacter sp. G13]WNJ20066.1 carbohydrate binding domain-containing protein [Pontibacter sp. G13]